MTHHVKDKIEMLNNNNVIYQIPCNNCKYVCIGHPSMLLKIGFITTSLVRKLIQNLVQNFLSMRKTHNMK